MRFLADMGVSRATVRAIRELGHDVEHLLEAELHRLSDADILERARKDRRIIIAFDLDFGDLLATGRDVLPSVVIARLTDQRPPSSTPKILGAIERFEKDLSTGAIVVVEDSRCRLRRLPLG